MRKIVCYFCLTLALGCSASPTKENADYYTLRGYHDYSIKIVQYKVKEGEPWAFLRMGVAYELGHGVKKDYKAAISWYEKTAFASRKNIRETTEGFIALYHLANLYLEGKGVAKNPEKAYEYMEIVMEHTKGKPLLYCCENDNGGGRFIAKEMISHTHYRAEVMAKKFQKQNSQ
ncbi:tetratricopeptide repeat protein [Candidatus Uabimicrobium sp. HlEnr_7]|uniref:tetratricopeptide repeat protein n=1 Tax=Candidatus Uabimicrobium helgolandensis TaxID=3095367 RepID=UPI0035579990